ncbi:beta-galactosidase 17 isoform X2 [Malania oleifera]|uniref:beta-galactosidase 17 isoform X2 n=1 Tax=Malania oleifera TaxID=397392 RepID=UPI0025AE8319|nr:beta-galactosidase 17 isoform X2 [Malania oleifera]
MPGHEHRTEYQCDRENRTESQSPYSFSLPKLSTMARRRSSPATFFFFMLVCLVAFAAFAPLPSLASSFRRKPVNARKFEIADDMFWKDGRPFQIIGGDLHYFRVHPKYWEDRLLSAKALGLNTIQTYVPWNLHEPRPGELDFEGIADMISFLKLCQKLGFLVMLRAGPYICAEWDFGGFPPWLLAIKPAVNLRSSDPSFLQLVERWWGNLLPMVAPLLYGNGGPIIMVQIENEYGSFGDDKAYLHRLVELARVHLGDNIILYTTDGGSRELLERGTIRGDMVYSAVDFETGAEPWPIFELQKEFNAPGKSPALSAEFYTGWLTHWGEEIAKTDANSTAAALKKILSRNGSAVLYMAHGGTNFGFYNGANTGADEYDYKPDLTSYDYDAPIKESGDMNSAKFKALQRVIKQHSAAFHRSIPYKKKMKAGYGSIQLRKTASLFGLLDLVDSVDVVESEDPLPMESVGQMFGFLLYITGYTAMDSISTLFIPKVHDRAQVFLSWTENNGGRPTYVGTIERWSNQTVRLPNVQCGSNVSMFILVENMGRVNYGKHMFDRKGILSSVYLDGNKLHGWKMVSIPLHNLNEAQKRNPIISLVHSGFVEVPAHETLRGDISEEPAFYAGHFVVDETSQVKDTFMSFSGWGKGIAFVNEFNIGRFWPSHGPQCNLYVPAPVLQHGENVILELESPNPELVVSSVDQPDFTCGSRSSNLHPL